MNLVCAGDTFSVLWSITRELFLAKHSGFKSESVDRPKSIRWVSKDSLKVSSGIFTAEFANLFRIASDILLICCVIIRMACSNHAKRLLVNLIFVKTGIPATFASSFINGLSTRWVLVIYPILARTRVASNKRVSSGASFKCKKTSNYSTCKLE